MSNLFLILAAVLFTTAMSGFFAGSETGAISANRLRLRHLQLEGDQRADDVIGLLSDTQRVLTVTLVGTNMFNILATLFAKQFFIVLLSLLNTNKPVQTAELVSLAVMTPFILIFAENVPKQFFREHADQLMLKFRKPLKFFSSLFIPAVCFFNGITYMLLRPLGIRKGHSRTRFTKEDLQNLVGTGENNGLKDQIAPPPLGEAGMIHSIFNLEKTLVREIMKPLVDVIALPLHLSTPDTVIDTVRRYGFSRLPVYENTIVNMVGYVDIYDILRGEREGGIQIGQEKTKSQKEKTSPPVNKPEGIISFVREPYYVPETKRIDDLLQEMLSRHISVAVVFDEFGGCSGFVTLEDILEEIVGEIDDEFDKRSILYYSEKPGVFVADARMDLDDLRDELNITFPKRNCETVGGFVYSILGRVPKEDEIITYGQYRIQVMEVKTPKIIRVRIEELEKK